MFNKFFIHTILASCTSLAIPSLALANGGTISIYNNSDHEVVIINETTQNADIDSPTRTISAHDTLRINAEGASGQSLKVSFDVVDSSDPTIGCRETFSYMYDRNLAGYNYYSPVSNSWPIGGGSQSCFGNYSGPSQMSEGFSASFSVKMPSLNEKTHSPKLAIINGSDHAVTIANMKGGEGTVLPNGQSPSLLNYVSLNPGTQSTLSLTTKKGKNPELSFDLTDNLSSCHFSITDTYALNSYSGKGSFTLATTATPGDSTLNADSCPILPAGTSTDPNNGDFHVGTGVQMPASRIGHLTFNNKSDHQVGFANVQIIGKTALYGVGDLVSTLENPAIRIDPNDNATLDVITRAGEASGLIFDIVDYNKDGSIKSACSFGYEDLPNKNSDDYSLINLAVSADKVSQCTTEPSHVENGTSAYSTSFTATLPSNK